MKRVEKIVYKGELIAIIIRKIDATKEYEFYSPEDAPLQVGSVMKKKGAKITPHIHEEPVKTVRVTQEVLYIEKGKLQIDLYDSKGKLIYQGILQKGDKVFLASGGHGFTILEDTVFFEVKQGPYPGYEKAKKYLSDQ